MQVDRRVLLGGAVAGTAVLLGRPATAASSPVAAGGGPTAFAVVGRGLRFLSGDGLPAVGQAAALSAELTEEASGLLGTLHGEYRALASPNLVGPNAPTSLETHHFVFPTGSLVGSGVATFDDTADEFAVIGGTGAFAGARGSYTAVQQPLGLGGDGSARYSFSLRFDRT